MSKRRILLVLVLFFLVALAAAAAYRVKSVAERTSLQGRSPEADLAYLSILQTDQVMAKVGDVSIRGRDIRDALQADFHGQALHASLSPQDLAIKIASAIDRVVEDELLAQEAGRRGLRTDLKGLPARQDLANQLFNSELAKLPPVTDQDMRSFYKSHGEKFYIPPGVFVKELFLPAESYLKEKVSTKEAVEKVTVLGKGLAERIRKGEKVEDLAREHTPEVFRDRAAGYLFKGGMMKAEDEQAILRLRPGQVHGPVRVEGGVSVFQGVSNVRAGLIPFYQAQEKIKAYLENVRSQELRRTLVEKAKQQVVVQRFTPGAAGAASGKS